MAAATQGDMVSFKGVFSSRLTFYRSFLKFYHLSLLFINQGAFVKALQKEKAGDGGDGKDAPEDMALD